MSAVKGTHKFQIVKTVLEVIYALTWVATIFAVITAALTYPGQQAALIGAGIIGGAIVFSTVLILTICTVDSRNLLSDIYALNLSEVEAYEREAKNSVVDVGESSKYDKDIVEFPKAA